MNDPPDRESLPHSLRVWDNAARFSLPLGLKIWLTVLVVTFLSSILFVADHSPARWILAGFVSSHLLVLALALAKSFTLRIGVVSLTHVTCWTPGFVIAIADAWNHHPGSTYGLWLYAIIVVIAISLLFDLRDAASYLLHLAAGKVSSEGTVHQKRRPTRAS